MPSTFARRGILVFLPVILVFSSVIVVYGNPTPTTLQASNITATSADLGGLIITNTAGQPYNTEWWFLVREGTVTNSQGEVPCPQQLGVLPGSIPQTSVSCPITGLKPSTTYFFNLYARWSGLPNQAGVWKSFTTLPGSPTQYTIDWALSNPSLSPPSPKVGDLATFNVIVTQLSSNWPGSLSLRLDVKLDGNTFDGIWVYTNQPGPIPVGITKTVSTKPWTATAGAHLVTWRLTFFGGDETVVITDPNGGNNEASLQFSVGAATSTFDFGLSLSPSSVSVKQGGTASFKILLTYSDPSYSGTVINVQVTGLGSGMNWQLTQAGDLTITTTSTTPTGSYMIVVTGSAMGVTHQTTATLVVTGEQTSTSVVITTPTTTTSSILTTATTSVPPSTTMSISTVTVEAPAQSFDLASALSNPMYLALILLAIAVVLVAALMRRRGGGSAPSSPAVPYVPPRSIPVTQIPTQYCMNCGSPLKPGNAFCGSCGKRAE